MPLAQRLADDIKSALKSGDKTRVGILRMVKAAVKNREIDLGTALTDEEISGVFRSFVKKAHEAIEQYSKAGRAELADKEKEELSVLEGYLPQQLGEGEIRIIVQAVISEIEATGTKDIGRVMKAVMAKTKGQADGKLVNNLVKEVLEAIGAA